MSSRRKTEDTKVSPRQKASEFDPHNLQPGAINVYDSGALNITDVVVGQLDELAGEASMLYNRQGAELAMTGQIHGLVTLPVTKASTKLAGYDYPGIFNVTTFGVNVTCDLVGACNYGQSGVCEFPETGFDCSGDCLSGTKYTVSFDCTSSSYLSYGMYSTLYF